MRSLTILLLLLPFLLPAQTLQFFNEFAEETDSTQSWKFRDEVTWQDNGWQYRKRFNTDNILVSEGAYSSFDKGRATPEGMHVHYRKTGDRWYTTTYADGRRVGLLQSYYPSGALKRTQRYISGILDGGECFNEDGTPRDFTPFEQQPEYPGGEEALLQFLNTQVNYPIRARENGIQGIAVVSFVVEKDGSVTEITLLKDPGGGIGEEALRVVRLMEPWAPGYQDDSPVKVRYTLPIKFYLESGRDRRKKKKAGKS